MNAKPNVSPIREGLRTTNAYLLAPNATSLIAFISKALAAKRLIGKRPDGAITYAEMRVGDSTLMLAGFTVEPIAEIMGRPLVSLLLKIQLPASVQRG